MRERSGRTTLAHRDPLALFETDSLTRAFAFGPESGTYATPDGHASLPISRRFESVKAQVSDYPRKCAG